MTHFTLTAKGRALKASLLKFWLAIPFGRICSMQFNGQTVTLYKSMWVTISDGRSRDALPVYLVSKDLVFALRARMTQLGYLEPEPTTS